ncbi:MAG: hypothetical protein ACRD5R_05145 [Candidatus Acidiferrales bacterium]
MPARPLATDAASAARYLGYELGATYFDACWGQHHTIIAAGRDSNGYLYVVSHWQDGGVTKHATYFDPKRDKRTDYPCPSSAHSRGTTC